MKPTSQELLELLKELVFLPGWIVHIEVRVDDELLSPVVVSSKIGPTGSMVVVSIFSPGVQIVSDGLKPPTRISLCVSWDPLVSCPGSRPVNALLLDAILSYGNLFWFVQMIWIYNDNL